VVLVLELPDALPTVRALSANGVAPTRIERLTPLVALTPEPVAGIARPDSRPGSATPELRAGVIVAGILLSNHALLL